jgi:hypothetical protein
MDDIMGAPAGNQGFGQVKIDVPTIILETKGNAITRQIAVSHFAILPGDFQDLITGKQMARGFLFRGGRLHRFIPLTGKEKGLSGFPSS